jgi:hypothetical protein
MITLELLKRLKDVPEKYFPENWKIMKWSERVTVHMRKHSLQDPININLPLITKANEKHYFSNLFW